MTMLYAAVARKAAAQHNPLAPTSVFVIGYIAVWTIFSLVPPWRSMLSVRPRCSPR